MDGAGTLCRSSSYHIVSIHRSRLWSSAHLQGCSEILAMRKSPRTSSVDGVHEPGGGEERSLVLEGHSDSSSSRPSFGELVWLGQQLSQSGGRWCGKLGMRPRSQLGSSSGLRWLAHRSSPYRSGVARDQRGGRLHRASRSGRLLHASGSGMGCGRSRYVPRTNLCSLTDHYICR